MFYFTAINEKFITFANSHISNLDYISSFKEPLEKDNPPEQYIISLAIKIYKFLNKFSKITKFFSDRFEFFSQTPVTVRHSAETPA